MSAIEAGETGESCELNPWHMDLDDPKLQLQIAAERLSIVRYVYLVQIEDGIATAPQRASLEYADAVLIGWPDADSPQVVDITDEQRRIVAHQMQEMEDYIGRFRAMEAKGDVDGMTDTLIRITERVAEVRRQFQPGFLLPTFAEIRRVVQAEWDEDMGKIDPDASGPSSARMQQETLAQAEGDAADGPRPGEGDGSAAS